MFKVFIFIFYWIAEPTIDHDQENILGANKTKKQLLCWYSISQNMFKVWILLFFLYDANLANE